MHVLVNLAAVDNIYTTISVMPNAQQIQLQQAQELAYKRLVL